MAEWLKAMVCDLSAIVGFPCKLVNEKVESGLYQTASEVVREALRLLKERDQAREQLRADVQAGFDQFASSEGRTYDMISGRQLAGRIKSPRRTARTKKSQVSYRLSNLAEQDPEEIWFYVAEDASPTTADRLIDAIFNRFEMLVEQPRMGRNRPEFGDGVRSFVVESYVIYYRYDEDLLIARVLHGRRDQAAAWSEPD